MFGQEKSHQREGRPGVARRGRTLCCLLDLGGCGTRSAETQASRQTSNSPRRHPRGQASCSARHRSPNRAMPALRLTDLLDLRKCRITQKAYGGLQAYLASPCLLCSREANLGQPHCTAESDQWVGWVGRIRQQETGCVPWAEEPSLSALHSECKCKLNGNPDMPLALSLH